METHGCYAKLLLAAGFLGFYTPPTDRRRYLFIY